MKGSANGSSRSQKASKVGPPRRRVAHEHHDKINNLVAPHTSASKSHALLDGFLQAEPIEHMSQNGYFSLPRGRGGNGCWGDLDMDGRLCHTDCVSSFWGCEIGLIFPLLR